ncbi:exosortase A [Marinobacter sp.]|uniref:exosortase A n=1 Tax=Marinobacter sp. TaxID=50741 RepID=UPI0034A20DBA
MNAASRLTFQHAWLLAIPLFAFALWGEWRDFFRLWYDSIVYNHGYLVLAGIVFLLFIRRDALASLTVNRSILALVLLAGASGVLLFAQAADVQFVRLTLVPVVILLWGWSIWGREFLKAAGGPILLLLFAVPFWDDFSPVLQHITVFFNDIFLALADIEAVINEFYIELEVGTFLVENGCSGVRYLMVALFLACFYGQLYYRSAPRTALLVVIAGLLSMLANWIRVFGIIAAGHYSNMESSLIEDHELFGWVIFLVVTLVPLFFIADRLDPRRSNDPGADTPHSTAPTPTCTAVVWPVIASFLVAWPSVIPLAVEARTERIAESWRPALPEGNGDWRGPLRHANIWQPDYQNPDIDLSGVYVSDDLQQVQLQITGYRRQTQHKELIVYGNELFDASEWQLVSSKKQTMTKPSPVSPERVNETIIHHRAKDRTIILWSWFDVGDLLTDSTIEAKVAGALKKISGDSRGALWALASYCSENGPPDCQQQRAAFARFLEGAER